MHNLKFNNVADLIHLYTTPRSMGTGVTCRLCQVMKIRQ